jgi:hypothetical protein
MKPIDKDAAWARLGWASHEEHRRQLRRRNRAALLQWGLVVLGAVTVLAAALVWFGPQ